MLVLNEASLHKCRILVNGMSKFHLIFLKLVYILSMPQTVGLNENCNFAATSAISESWISDSTTSGKPCCASQ